MKKNDIIKIAAIGFIGVVLVPIVIGAGINLINLTVVGTTNVVNKVRHSKKIKKGLKDGSIVEIDGQYYEVNVEEA